MQPKLTIEMIPATMFGMNLRAILPKSAWDSLRKDCYAAAGHRCEVCNQTGFRGRVECHERWEFDDKHHVQRLVGLICLCPTCHRAKHIGRTLTMGDEKAFEAVCWKLMQVNGWTPAQLDSYIEESFKLFNQRSRVAWRLDIGWLESKKELIGA